MKQKSVLSGVKVAVIGAGNMGRALVKGLVEHSVYPQHISVYDVDPKKTAALRHELAVKVAKSGRQAVSLADIVILAVKPQTLQPVAEDLATSIADGAFVLSIAAGVPIAKIESFFKRQVAVVRAMPNMPALVGAGMSAFAAGKFATGKHKKLAEAVLSAFGEAVALPEKTLDLVTAVSGSGPAYFFLLAEKMIEAAYEGGLKADVAKKLVYQTAFGAGRVLADSQEDPDALVSRVASKGGTTEAALGVFRKKGFGKIVNEAIRAAARRSRELREGK
jgi:pyrroline-5-carboxylate reductase